MMHVKNRAQPDARRFVALETTLLAHGVPKAEAQPLANELDRIILDAGALPAVVGVVHGVPTVGLTAAELDKLLHADDVPKANTSNLGVLMHRGGHAATTVSATMEIAAAAGVQVFATGGIGGVHRGFAVHPDISADLCALARFPVAVVASGVKAILDVPATREALETLGVPVIGFQTDRFPAFYLRDGGTGVDARFDDADALGRFLASELARTGRGVLVVQAIAAEHEIARSDWDSWLNDAANAAGSEESGRNVTPRMLAELHARSGGMTLRANLALVKGNAHLAAMICRSMCKA
ncbi:MAG: pseudouridine-5'-phosphate glycosidase [Phycisphaeraceae bacterium]|nr:pseudouridine-5'-phosphate glycosidase [Phycisphaeraceae bacterium]MCW5753169.1 pseudouridine-5'-phosphate glycosidase [Phycisphaeraceae bacterium]